MNVQHRLVGYRKTDEELADQHTLPSPLLDLAKRLAGVREDDLDAVWCYPLHRDPALTLATAIGATIDPDANAYFLEGFATTDAMGDVRSNINPTSVSRV